MQLLMTKLTSDAPKIKLLLSPIFGKISMVFYIDRPQKPYAMWAWQPMERIMDFDQRRIDLVDIKTKLDISQEVLPVQEVLSYLKSIEFTDEFLKIKMHPNQTRNASMKISFRKFGRSSAVMVFSLETCSSSLQTFKMTTPKLANQENWHQPLHIFINLKPISLFLNQFLSSKIKLWHEIEF